MPDELDAGPACDRFDQEVRDWIEEAANLVAAAEQQLSALRGSKSEARDYLRRARSLLTTSLEWSEKTVEDGNQR